MTLHSSIRVFDDPDDPAAGVLRFGVGLVPMSEAEQKACDDEIEAPRLAALERQREREFLARNRGEEGEKRHTVQEYLATLADKDHDRQRLVIDADVQGAKPRPAAPSDPDPDDFEPQDLRRAPKPLLPPPSTEQKVEKIGSKVGHLTRVVSGLLRRL